MGDGARRPTIGLLALVGMLLVGCSGDDGGASSPATTEGEEQEEEASSGTGEFEAELDEDEPVAAFPVELEAGDALRVVVEGLDTALLVAASEDADTAGFKRLVGADAEDLEDHASRNLVLLAGHVLDDDEYLDFENAYFEDELDVDELRDAVADVVDEVEDAGTIFMSTDRSSDDVEGLQLVAPTSGTYTVFVATDDEGEADVNIEVEPGDDDGLDGDEIRYSDYLVHYGEHAEFFCDEDFYGADPEDVTNYGPSLCDPEELQGVLEGGFSGDFTNDFGGGL